MSTNDRLHRGEHPSDELPDFVRGTLSRDRQREVEAHVQGCSVCSADVDILSLLAEQPVASLTADELSRIYGRIRFDRPVSGSAARGPDWRSGLWKVAAAIAVLITGLGVWQVYLTGSATAGWSAADVIAAWERDVSELAPSSDDAEALLAFIEPVSNPYDDAGLGAGDFEPLVDGLLDGLDSGVVDGITTPWEE